ncbi:hypothetical protein KIN20_029590 [Parelaphostrongylus tenuis]|uniref:Uncharacterized protein n=1 Tax=Parelaphostrongylus tenuis TaxID=148309 RepID=A0AAD5R3H1_PARTN|nr:hypothetical protein KIN20_029590 [Parelaphostrongylus tenuis]
MKQIYRSLAVISLSVVLGWSSTTIIMTINMLLQANVERLQVDLLAGPLRKYGMRDKFLRLLRDEVRVLLVVDEGNLRLMPENSVRSILLNFTIAVNIVTATTPPASSVFLYFEKCNLDDQINS